MSICISIPVFAFRPLACLLAILSVCLSVSPCMFVCLYLCPLTNLTLYFLLLRQDVYYVCMYVCMFACPICLSVFCLSCSLHSCQRFPNRLTLFTCFSTRFPFFFHVFVPLCLFGHLSVGLSGLSLSPSPSPVTAAMHES